MFIAKIKHFSCKTQETVVGGKIEDQRNCGYARMKILTCAIFHVLSRDEAEAKEEKKQQPNHP